MYNGAPITFSLLWPNFAASFVMGFLAEDRNLFREEWGVTASAPSSDSSAESVEAAKTAHGVVKKTVPLFVGLTTGFCGWFTSFSIAQTYSGLTSNTTIPDGHHWHLIHCFDYLCQAIMCTADVALEGLETTTPDHNGGSDGWDSKHVCKDYGQVINYLESVRPYGHDGQTIE